MKGLAWQTARPVWENPLLRQNGLANRKVDPPPQKSEAPDPAATGSSASNTYLGKGERTNTTGNRQRIVGTLFLRIGGAA